MIMQIRRPIRGSVSPGFLGSCLHVQSLLNLLHFLMTRWQVVGSGGDRFASKAAPSRQALRVESYNLASTLCKMYILSTDWGHADTSTDTYLWNRPIIQPPPHSLSDPSHHTSHLFTLLTILNKDRSSRITTVAHTRHKWDLTYTLALSLQSEKDRTHLKQAIQVRKLLFQSLKNFQTTRAQSYMTHK